jgi:hypothetical protein
MSIFLSPLLTFHSAGSPAPDQISLDREEEKESRNKKETI